MKKDNHDNIWNDYHEWHSDMISNLDLYSIDEPEELHKIVIENEFCCKSSDYHYIMVNKLTPLYYLIIIRGINPLNVSEDGDYCGSGYRPLFPKLFRYCEEERIRCDENEYKNGKYKIIMEHC